MELMFKQVKAFFVFSSEWLGEKIALHHSNCSVTKATARARQIPLIATRHGSTQVEVERRKTTYCIMF